VRKILVGAIAIGLVLAGAGYGALGRSSGLSLQRQADLYSINQIEKTWHRSTSKKNLELMMSLWVPHASMTIGGDTYAGKKAIRGVFARSGPFQPQNHWISDTAAYKIRATVHGVKGTIYFECHYIDVDTGKVALVTGTDLELRKIGGKWLITNFTAASVTLKP